MLGQEGGNVSSDQLDKQEIKDIAAELKKDLRGTAPAPDVPEPAVEPPLIVSAQPAPIAVKPAPAAPTEERPNPLHLKPKASGGPNPEDTIFIDNEGKLHANDPATQSAPKQ